MAKSRRQKSINVRYLSDSRSAVRSGGIQVGGFGGNDRLVGQIFLSRRLIVRQRSVGIIFIFQPALASAAGFRSVDVPLQFVFVSWAITEVICHTIPIFSVINLVFWRVRITCLTCLFVLGSDSSEVDRFAAGLHFCFF